MTLVVLLGVFNDQNDSNKNDRQQQEQAEQQKIDCQRAIEILTLDNVHYEIVIGTDPTEQDATKLLFELAGPTNQKYPQCFFEEEVITHSLQQQDRNPNQQQRRSLLSCNNNNIVGVGGDVIYLGDIKFLESMHICGTIPGTGLGKQKEKINIPHLHDDLDSTCHSYITIQSTDSDYQKWCSVAKTNQPNENKSNPTSMTIIVENNNVGGTVLFPSQRMESYLNLNANVETSSEYAIYDCRNSSNVCSSVLSPGMVPSSTTETKTTGWHLLDNSENEVSSLSPTTKYSEGMGTTVKTPKSTTKKKKTIAKNKESTTTTTTNTTTSGKVDTVDCLTNTSLSPPPSAPSNADIETKTPKLSTTKSKTKIVTKESNCTAGSSTTSRKKSPKKGTTNVSIATPAKTSKLQLNEASNTVGNEACFDFKKIDKSPIVTQTTTVPSSKNQNYQFPSTNSKNFINGNDDDDDDDDISDSSSTVQDDTDIICWTTKSGNIRSSPIKRNNSKSLIIRHNSTGSNSGNTSTTSFSESSRWSKNSNLQHTQQQQQQQQQQPMKPMPLLEDSHHGVSKDGNICKKSIENEFQYDSSEVIQVYDISSTTGTTDTMTKQSIVNKQRFQRPCMMRGNSITDVIKNKYDTNANDNNSSISSIAGETMLPSDVLMSMQTPKVTNRMYLRPGMIRGNSFRDCSQDENVANNPNATTAVTVTEVISNDEIIINLHSNIDLGQCNENKCHDLVQYDNDDYTALNPRSNNNFTKIVENCNINKVDSCSIHGITNCVCEVSSSSFDDCVSLKPPKRTNGNYLRPGMIRGNPFINHSITEENNPKDHNPTTTITTTATTTSIDKVLGMKHNSRINIDDKECNKNICNDLEHDNDNDNDNDNASLVVIDVVYPTTYTSTVKHVSPIRRQLRPGMIRGNSLERI